MRFKQAVGNIVVLCTFCYRLEQYLCSICEFKRRGGVSMGHYFLNLSCKIIIDTWAVVPPKCIHVTAIVVYTHSSKLLKILVVPKYH